MRVPASPKMASTVISALERVWPVMCACTRGHTELQVLAINTCGQVSAPPVGNLFSHTHVCHAVRCELQRKGGATVVEAGRCSRCLVTWVLSSLFGNRSSLQNRIRRIVAWFENAGEATGLQ